MPDVRWVWLDAVFVDDLGDSWYKVVHPLFVVLVGRDCVSTDKLKCLYQRQLHVF